MTNQELVWGQPGLCPSCGVVTEHIWFDDIIGKRSNPLTGKIEEQRMVGSQGRPQVSLCVSQDCQGIAFWFGSYSGVPPTREISLVYPQEGFRKPPEDGLTEKETRLYKEAAAVAPVSPRAACALVRALLETLLKRSLKAAGLPFQTNNGWDKPLTDLIDMAVANLPLSATLMGGLTAIRKRGNDAVHDPYGLTDDTRAEELPWLFQAVDDLVDDLHIKPQRWAGMTAS